MTQMSHPESAAMMMALPQSLSAGEMIHTFVQAFATKMVALPQFQSVAETTRTFVPAFVASLDSSNL